MDTNQILAYVQAAQVLVAAGAATVAEIKQMFGAHQAMTDDALNEILAAVAADAARREALAEGDAGEAPGGNGSGG